MKWHDVTLPIVAGMAVWPGDPPVEVRPIASLAAGDSCSVSSLQISSHTGTHVDAPAHFLAGGASVDTLALEVLIGPCRVAELLSVAIITRGDLEKLSLRRGERLLLKTRNSARTAANGGRFDPNYVAMAPDAADYLSECGVALVGIDALSIETFINTGHVVHKRLLAANVIVLEGLDLGAVAAGNYQLVCLPLRLQDGDGAPARVLLGSAE